ncbi:hypothetical protein [Nocardia wallacei]|uniref:hypothetical protein n=1 Tax=Nocardia wallacei TaxID=480035 RepID=UPI002453C53C|nr:hypothetical protein [Nocardia wallacei]
MPEGVAFGVVAHTARRPAAELLAAQLGAYLSVDDGTLGAVGNHRHVWEVLVDAPARWVCVVEDDAVPVTDFGDQLAAALAAAPSPVVSLYLGRSRPPGWTQRQVRSAVDAADSVGACWVMADRMLHAVGVCLRANLVRDMLTHTRHVRKLVPVDQRFDRWLRLRKLRVAYSVPSLVDHRDGPTLIEHPDGQPRTEPRTAWRTGGRAAWTSLTVPVAL